MRINYGVFIPTDTPKHRNPKKRRKFVTGSIEMNITQEDWDKDDHKDIREAIRAKVPNLCGWHGYCIAPAEGGADDEAKQEGSGIPEEIAGQ